MSRRTSDVARAAMAAALSAAEVAEVMRWARSVPLTRTPRNVARDFSDGVLVAEIVNHFVPAIVELHNYSAASNSTQKVRQALCSAAVGRWGLRMGAVAFVGGAHRPVFWLL